MFVRAIFAIKDRSTVPLFLQNHSTQARASSFSKQHPNRTTRNPSFALVIRHFMLFQTRNYKGIALGQPFAIPHHVPVRPCLVLQHPTHNQLCHAARKAVALEGAQQRRVIS
jgi:hypothetical protein